MLKVEHGKFKFTLKSKPMEVMMNRKFKNIVTSLIIGASILLPTLKTLAYNPGEVYNLSQTLDVYINAEDALNKVNPIKTYGPGSYFIYKEAQGMINISKTKGSPGAWINPTSPSNKINEGQDLSTSLEEKEVALNNVGSGNIVGNIFILNGTVKTYVTASNAKNDLSPYGTYSKGNYFIYKEYDGMLNISKNAGIPGAWINPEGIDKVNPPKESVTIPLITKTRSLPITNNAPIKQIEGEKYTLKATKKTFVNAQNALNNVNPVGSYSQGNYYVYKKSNGMLNISRTPGIAGAWINPNSQSSTSEEVITNKPMDLSKYKEVTFELTFYTDLPSENGGYSISASGKPLKYGLVASNVYPFGTKIILDGMGTFIVGDRGGYEFNSYNRLDVLIERKAGESDYEYQQRVLRMGRPTVKGYVER